MSNEHEHSYIWRYFIKLYAENVYEQNGSENVKVICEKCEIELQPDGKFQIVAVENEKGEKCTKNLKF